MGQSVTQEDWFAVFKFRVTVRAHLMKYDCLLIFWQPDLIGWYIIISWSVLCKNWIIVFKIRVTVKVKNFIVSSCISYLLCHWSLGNQTRFVDFLLTKPSTKKWACTYSSTLDYSIARHIAWDYFAVLGDNACLFRNHSDGLHWSPKMNAFDGWKFLREISLYIQCTHMFGSHNCGILKPGIVMS